MAHVVYVLGALVEVGVPKHLRYDDHGDVKGSVTHHKVPVMFANALALHVLGPPDPPLVPGRPHLHLVKRQFLISYVEISHLDHLRKCDHRLVVLHSLRPLLYIFFDIAEATWTVVLQVFREEAGHPVPTLEPVQLVKVFLQGVWQAAHIKSLLQHHLQSLNFSLNSFLSSLDIPCWRLL